MRNLVAFLVIAALGGLIAARALAAEPVEIMGEDGTAEISRGIWSSPQSGWLLEIDAEGIRRWQVTPAACYRSPTDGPTLMGQIEYRYMTPLAGGDRAHFQYLPGDGRNEFHRLGALPEACNADTNTAPDAVFEVFVSIFQQHYAHFERRGMDWSAAVDAARPSVHAGMSEAELFELLAGLIAPLADSHTKLFATLEDEPRRAQYGLGETLPRINETIGETPWLIGLINQLFQDVLDPGAQHIANDRVITGTIEDRVGYLQFLTMGGFVTGHEAGTPEWAAAELAALDTIMDEALTRFSGMEAVILDLSNNRGGYDAICRAIAARFTDTEFHGYSVRSAGSDRSAERYDIAPATGPRFTGPVYVLTSDVTVSCGEITTLMLRQLDTVTQVGATTRGAFSTPLAKPLPNGWYLELSNEVFADASGAVFEGRGLTPDIELEVFPTEAPIAGHARAIEAILADLDR